MIVSVIVRCIVVFCNCDIVIGVRFSLIEMLMVLVMVGGINCLI